MNEKEKTSRLDRSFSKATTNILKEMTASQNFRQKIKDERRARRKKKNKK